MTKKRTTLSARRKEAINKKRDFELESLCRKCGSCCHVKVGLSDGSYVLHPFITCKYLTVDNKCSVYEKRVLCDGKICVSREEMISTDYMLPEGCPYAKLRPGYRASRMVTQAEFDDIIIQELEAGNYNILLANRAF